MVFRICLLSLWLLPVPAQTLSDHNVRLKLLHGITEIPRTSLNTLEASFSKKSILPWTAIVASTWGLYIYDQAMIDEVERWGRSSGIGNADYTRTVWRAGDVPLIRFPSDTGSALYFLGDGWTHFSIAGGFLLSGQFSGGNRAHNTGVQIIHGIIVSTIFSQVIKHATGRESPSEASEDRGAWRPFPSIREYNANTPRYDAFPSGHVMTATLTFTIINSNYPEYSYITLPIAGTSITLLGLQMMNNSVHWASDYPLALAMGYVIGKMSTRMGQNEVPPTDGREVVETIVYPSVFAGTQTLNILKTF